MNRELFFLISNVKCFVQNLLPSIQQYQFPQLSNGEFVNITSIFEVINAKSKSYELYDYGNVAFITNGLFNNGIVGYVTPDADDRVFNEKCICVSAFCEATIQEPPFLPRGNGGSGLIVLKPKKNMTDSELHFYAAFINKYCSWRFHYGRMVTLARFMRLTLPKLIS